MKFHKRRSLKLIALVACLPLITVVAGATTLYPQTSKGAQQWIAKQWSEQLARGTDTDGATAGVTTSMLGNTGFDISSKITWSQYGLARLRLQDVTDPTKPRLIGGGSSMKLTKDVKMKVARFLSPAIAKELESFQETHAANPITKITLEGKTEEFRGFGHFEIKNEADKVIIVADVAPIKI